ncbi:MAG: Uma2 family endonuclease [Candidatus Rokubacteria bacterium]|nr:Uma2 family endonuclease [Candidatus Rokubacteria bacterium]
MSERPLPAGKLSFEEFLAWCDEDTWAEWVDGKVVMVSPASNRHQDVRDFLAFVMRVFSEARGLGIVRTAPFLMRLPTIPSGREPDLLFLAAVHQDRLKETYLDGPADLVVEIVSPESRLRDRGEKFAEYELGGVQEYWILDLDLHRADFYRLDSEGRYRLAEPEVGGRYRSMAVPGFWLRLEWLWQEPLPSPVRVVAEIAGVAPAVADAFERALRGEKQNPPASQASGG